MNARNETQKSTTTLDYYNKNAKKFITGTISVDFGIVQNQMCIRDSYYTVDAIHNAISENKKIKFQYFQWNVKKEMELRHGGAWYHISPWGLSWDDENYYMIGYDTEAQLIKHYRVDKMLHRCV